ncbi:MAG: electron transport complex subunit RsxC [Lachnospiraceae bacterium]|nr:electron transport complex subunit RsxC [Lachnospiraceae bacterium]
MKLLTFQGGVHPYDGKELSKDQPIKELKPGKELAFLVSQHIGAPAKPCVEKGDRVLAGQKIAEAGGFVSAPIFSSVSGTVKGIEKRKNAPGGMVDAIIVENDEQYETVEFSPINSLDDLSNEEIVGRIKDAGVVGMGGAGFPTHVKLSPKDPSKIDYILVNGAECEPYLTSDYRSMIEMPEKIVQGLRCILKLFDSAKGVIAIENNKPEAIRIMQEAVKGESRMSVAVMQTKYPEGAERCLISAITGREVNSKMLPADAGCIVDNISTLIAVNDAVMLGKPLYHRVFTITGEAIANPSNFDVLVGQSYSEIVAAAGGFKSQPEKIISGGPMMGFAQSDLTVPVTKTSGAITAFLTDPVSKTQESACINCGRCVSGCPARLMPCKLSDYAEHGDAERFEAEFGLECVNCGSCSFQCPAKRPLAANINTMRQTVLANKRKKK